MMNLTMKERWIQLKMPNGSICGQDGVVRERTVVEFKRLIRQRKSNLKFKYAVEAIKRLYEAMEGSDYVEFQSAISGMEDAMKFQGYLQMSIAFLENKMVGVTDEEVKRQLLVMEL